MKQLENFQSKFGSLERLTKTRQHLEIRKAGYSGIAGQDFIVLKIIYSCIQEQCFHIKLKMNLKSRHNLSLRNWRIAAVLKVGMDHLNGDHLSDHPFQNRMLLRVHFYRNQPSIRALLKIWESALRCLNHSRNHPLSIFFGLTKLLKRNLNSRLIPRPSLTLKFSSCLTLWPARRFLQLKSFSLLQIFSQNLKGKASKAQAAITF